MPGEGKLTHIKIFQRARDGKYRILYGESETGRTLDDIKREYPEVEHGFYQIQYGDESFTCDMEPFTL